MCHEAKAYKQAFLGCNVMIDCIMKNCCLGLPNSPLVTDFVDMLFPQIVQSSCKSELSIRISFYLFSFFFSLLFSYHGGKRPVARVTTGLGRVGPNSVAPSVTVVEYRYWFNFPFAYFRLSVPYGIAYLVFCQDSVFYATCNIIELLAIIKLSSQATMRHLITRFFWIEIFFLTVQSPVYHMCVQVPAFFFFFFGLLN